jgi:hypothetical protein
MTWLTPNFSITDAINAHEDAYDMLVGPIGGLGDPPGPILPAGWGSADDPVNGNLQFPIKGQAGLPSLAGIAIGPLSTVDRAWLSWFSQKPGTNSDQFLKRVSLDNPLLTSLPANPGTIGTTGDPALALSQGNLYVFSSSATFLGQPITSDATFLPTFYRKADGLHSQTFGIAAPAGVFIGPLLHLLLYLKQPVAPPPTKRFPQLVKATTTVNFGNMAEAVTAQIPVYGRKHIIIEMVMDDIANFRIGALRAMGPLISATDHFPNRETTEATATAVAAGQTARFELDNANIDYLTLNSNSTFGAATFCSFYVQAYD